MREAGVTLVTVGVFAWAWLEPSEGTYAFDELDTILDLLHAGGIAVDLATATASPPPWLSQRYPEILPVDQDGRRLWPGSRQAFCPSSPIVRERQLALVEQLAEPLRRPPGARPVARQQRARLPQRALLLRRERRSIPRAGCADRYADLDTLNDAWGTAFWSQRYSRLGADLPASAYDDLGQPDAAPRLLAVLLRRAGAPVSWRSATCSTRRPLDIPVTTNLMLPNFKFVDGFALGRACDLVSNDHYLLGELPDSHLDLAIGADLSRGVAGGEPWLLMEHSTSAVNWQPRNLAKEPGQMRRDSLTHVARGSDGAMFFQWRASAAGAEKFHSALLPHAGTDSRIWQESVQLGRDLARPGRDQRQSGRGLGGHRLGLGGVVGQ